MKQQSGTQQSKLAKEIQLGLSLCSFTKLLERSQTFICFSCSTQLSLRLELFKTLSQTNAWTLAMLTHIYRIAFARLFKFITYFSSSFSCTWYQKGVCVQMHATLFKLFFITSSNQLFWCGIRLEYTKNNTYWNDAVSSTIAFFFCWFVKKARTRHLIEHCI